MNKLWYLLAAVVAAAAVAGLSWGLSYGGSYSPPPERATNLEALTVPSYTAAAGPVVVDRRVGKLVVDTVHFNFFLEGELEPLLSKVSGLGYDVDYFGDRLAFRFIRDASERASIMEDALRGADSLLVVAPIIEYGAEDAEVVRRFVGKGGKLLVMAEPTRFHLTNSLVTSLGINYENDLLYNVVENESNYRNVLFRDFAPHAVTNGLSTIALYATGSITGEAEPLIFGDENTRSSRREGAALLTPMVSVMDGRVVAIGDSTFMRPPFNEVLDNDLFLANLADFLTTSERIFDIEDFPAPFDNDVAVTIISAEALDSATQLVEFLSSGARRARLETLERPAVDTVFLGLYADRAEVEHHLQVSQVQFSGGQIRTPSTLAIPQRGSGLVLLDSRAGRNVLVIMASSERDMAFLVRLVITGEYRTGLVSPTLGLYDFG